MPLSLFDQTGLSGSLKFLPLTHLDVLERLKMPIHRQSEYEGVQAARVGRFNRGINTTFVVYRIGTTLIDTGPSNQWRPVREFLDQLPPEQLLLTHHHEDHSGNAARIARRYGVTPLAPELGRLKLANGYPTPLIQKLVWGSPHPVQTHPLPERIEVSADCTLVPIATPGHAKDLTCLWWEQRGWLFSGDLYLSHSLTHLRSDENLLQLMQSIAMILRLKVDVLFCSHRGIVTDGHTALTTKLNNLKRLCVEAHRLQSQGVDEAVAVKQLLGPEDGLSKISRYNISKRNLVRQAAKVSLDAVDQPQHPRTIR